MGGPYITILRVVFWTLQLSFEHTLISQSPSKHSARGSTERERELDKNT